MRVGSTSSSIRAAVVANSSRTPDGIVTMISMNSGTCGRVQFGKPARHDAGRSAIDVERADDAHGSVL